ncbi:MAG TPA: arsenate reductase (azurin) small subunit [Candidatus Dormibacteraeota bacterium]|nr:arsenate reductase (azurin) small subunit [Candidatus Dormibacteraeota bacterium]
MPISRRSLLGAGGAIAAAGIAARAAAPAGAAEAPRKAVGKAGEFLVGKPVAFAYPDARAPAIAVRLREPVPYGAGPHHDIVAYSQLCVHKGCPVGYNAKDEIFVCPCHWSTYDPAKDGQMIIGHATTDLPRIELAYDAKTDELTAVGVHGLIYGRSSNEPRKDGVL